MSFRLPPFRHGPTTYSSATRSIHNVAKEFDCIPAMKKQYTDLWAQRESIEALVRYHLRLGSGDVCTVLDPQVWIEGSFNVCVLVEVATGGLTTKYVFRCPKPYRLVGMVDEKLSSEVGAYVWMQEKCSDVPIPHLFGFGFSDGRQFTHVTRRPYYVRFLHSLWRSIYAMLQFPVLSQYTKIWTAPNVRIPYMLLEHIGSDEVQMLSNTLYKHKYKEDPGRRKNLFHGLTRIMLSLARVPQPRIGSFSFYDDGSVALANRYLSCSVAVMENDGAPRSIPQNHLHFSTDSFVSDILSLHDGHFLTQPHAVYNENSCRRDMAVLSLLRAISHRHIKQEYRNGPYLVQLTDVNPSNIFVDNDWNVKGLVDLEWICAAPVEMLEAPHWLTGCCCIDEINGTQYARYEKVRQEFLSILEQEEQGAKMEHGISLSGTMGQMWDSKGVWFWHCLTSVDATDFLLLLQDHVFPPGCLSSEVERAVSELWCDGAGDVVKRKLADRAKYDEMLKACFSKE